MRLIAPRSTKHLSSSNAHAHSAGSARWVFMAAFLMGATVSIVPVVQAADPVPTAQTPVPAVSTGTAAPATAAPATPALDALAAPPAPARSTHVGLALTGGLSGLGADLGVNINEYLGVRATVAGFNYSHNGNYGTSVGWDAKLKLFQAGLLLDVYPFAGGFHLTAGAVNDGNKFTLTGQPSGGNFTFNGNTYAAANVGSASASVDWSKTVPYLGLGFGNLSGSSGFHFTTDLGVLFSGSANAQITATCSTAGQAVPGLCAQLATDAQAEQTKLQNDVHKLNVWPVFRIGIGYAF